MTRPARLTATAALFALLAGSGCGGGTKEPGGTPDGKQLPDLKPLPMPKLDADQKVPKPPPPPGNTKPGGAPGIQ